ncbi:MAG: alpha/beta hydrolase [Devosia sp.]
MKIIRRIIVGLGLVAVLAYLAGLVGLYVLQRQFQYDPTGRIYALSETTLTNVETISLPVSDGQVVAGWYAPPTEAGKPVILYLRGNAGSYTFEHYRFEAFQEAGYGFLSFDYRGFPGSPGEISQTNILADSLIAYDWLAEKGAPIVIWGRSLGSGPASYLASERAAGALVLETPFLSAVSVARDRYWFFPVEWLMFDQFPVERWIETVDEPTFVGHGTADDTIGVSHGERVHQRLRNPGPLWIVEGAGHSDLWDRGIWAEVEPFIASVMTQ